VIRAVVFECAAICSLLYSALCPIKSHNKNANRCVPTNIQPLTYICNFGIYEGGLEVENLRLNTVAFNINELSLYHYIKSWTVWITTFCFWL